MCGIFGVFNGIDIEKYTYTGLQSLQHRGQNSYGVIMKTKNKWYETYHPGLVNFNNMIHEESIGNSIGHVRYPTNTSNQMQPIREGNFAFAYNGQIESPNMNEAILIQESLKNMGEITKEKLKTFLNTLKGAFAIAILYEDKLFLARDRNGIRPLVIGFDDEMVFFSSETCALPTKSFINILPGSIYEFINHNGKTHLDSIYEMGLSVNQPCLFESFYFSRPDSIFANTNKSFYEIRHSSGQYLWKEEQYRFEENSVVVPVPDSGIPSAVGYSESSGIPLTFAIVRNQYVGRSFIQPSQDARELIAKTKHTVNKNLVKDQEVILIDDSLVRGTTSKSLISKLRDAGAKEIHLRIASPPVLYSDYYGIDLPDTYLLLAKQFDNDWDMMASVLGVDSLGYLSIESIYMAHGYEERNDIPQLMDRCFTGQIPIDLDKFL